MTGAERGERATDGTGDEKSAEERAPAGRLQARRPEEDEPLARAGP